MTILLITQWYKPIKSAASNRTARIAEHLAKSGHKVTVLTGLPSYPTGILPRKYHRKLWFKEKIDKISVIRTYEYPAPNKGIFKRLLNNISFMISASIAVIFLPKYDLVMVSSPAFLAGIPGLLATKKRFIFDVRDLWPDSAIALGFIKYNWLKNGLEKLEKLYYRKADFITVATPSIRQHLIKEQWSEKKIIELPNSVDTNLFKPIKIDRKTFGFSKNDLIVAFTGNHGAAQGLEVTLQAANLLKNYADIKFLFVGEGEEKEDLIKIKEKLKLKNVIFWPEKNREEILKIINMADLGNISLTNKKIFQDAIPSKTLEFIACGKPIITGVNGFLKELVESCKIGLVYKHGKAKEMANQILRFQQNKNDKKNATFGQNCRQVALKYFSDKTFFRNLDQIMKTLTENID